MKITRISIYQSIIPIEPFSISHGRIMSTFDETKVCIETDEGIIGWGDTVPWGSNFIAAFANGARAGLKELAPKLIGQDPRMIGAINELMDAEMTGQPYVKTALDVACWDILGKSLGVPLYMLMGGKVNPNPIVYGSIPPYISEKLDAEIKRLREMGFKRYSSKSSGDVSKDIEYLRYVGERLQPGEFIKYDGNGGWRADEAMRVARGMGDIDVYFEQPCATYEECREVRKTTGVPLILDESATSVEVILRAREDGVLDGLNLKLAKVGGLSKMRLIRDLCATLHVPMEIQDSSWSELACSAIAHVAVSTPAHSFMSMLRPMGMKLKTIKGGPTYKNGRVQVTETPGIGAEPKKKVLGKPIAVYE